MDGTRIAGFKIKRNRNWWASVTTGLEFGLWWAPTSFYHAVVEPLLGAIDFILLATWRLLAWAGLTVSILALGISGFLVRAEVPAPVKG